MRTLTTEETEISPPARLPNYTGPTLDHQAGSIAQGDTIDNNDNLPDAGGGVLRESNPASTLYPPVAPFRSSEFNAL
jgi:hypothetical protein